MDAAQRNRTGLEAVLFYLLATLISAPRAQAVALLDLINLDGLEPLLPPAPASPQAGTQEVADRFVAAWAAIGANDYAAGMRALRTALADFCALVDKAGYNDAQVIVDWLLGQIAASTPANLTELLGIAGGVSAAARGAQSPDPVHLAKLAVSAMTRGRANEFAAWAVSARHPGALLSSGGLFGFDDPTVRRLAIAEMSENGYHRFSTPLPSDMVERLRKFGETVPCNPHRAQQSVDRATLLTFDRVTGDIDALQVPTDAVVGNEDVQALLADPSLIALAQDYLGCEPILSPPNMWWSMPTDRAPSSELAQFFHYDMDWWKFFKIFIYLTDVDEDGGPHAYVRGSHRVGAKPAALLDRGYARIPDHDILQHYPASDLVRVLGPAGSIVVGDTRCWHKGDRPSRNARLMLQLEWSATQAHGNALRKPVVEAAKDPRFGALMRERPYMMQHFAGKAS